MLHSNVVGAVTDDADLLREFDQLKKQLAFGDHADLGFMLHKTNFKEYLRICQTLFLHPLPRLP